MIPDILYLLGILGITSLVMLGVGRVLAWIIDGNEAHQ